MQNRTLSLSLLIGAALTIPSLAMAAPTTTDDMKPVDMATVSADNTQKTEGEDAEDEQLSTTPSTFEINETQTISSSNASINNDNNQAVMATEIEAVQVPQEDMPTPQEAEQVPQKAKKASQEAGQIPQTLIEPQS